MPYSVAIIITGVFRSFTEKLWPFLRQLPHNFHFYINIPNDNTYDTYYNKKLSIDTIINDPRIKNITIDNNNISMNTHTQRENNIVLQWYRIHRIFQEIPSTYDFYVRCRPDIQITSTIGDFLSIFDNIASTDSTLGSSLYIPSGFDQTNSHFLPKENNIPCINDQFAIGTYTSMKHYTNLYSETAFVSPIVSEHILYAHLQSRDISIHRFELSYKLVLSECFVISICGDSGSGKSTLSKLIQETLPFDKTVLLETDRYHKWERGHENYQTYTHLHPEANNLEKLSEDAFKLKLGEDIFTVDYDHSTGRFTEPEHIQPAPYTIFCGLHTLYKESLRELCDLKIYIDTHEELKMRWKMERDTAHRGTSAHKLLQTMERRKPDFKSFIDPQKDSADIIFHYAPGPESSVNFHLKVRPPYIQYVHDGLIPYSENIIEESDGNTYTFHHDIPAEMLGASAQKLNYRIHRLKDGHDGLIQYIILLLTWKH
jgi:uridine kinase